MKASSKEDNQTLSIFEGPFIGTIESCSKTDNGIIISLATAKKAKKKDSNKSIEKKAKHHFFIRYSDLINEETIPRIMGQRAIINNNGLSTVSAVN